MAKNLIANVPASQSFLLPSKSCHERDKFELLLNQVGFTRQMTMQGVSGSMSIKDLLAEIITDELRQESAPGGLPTAGG